MKRSITRWTTSLATAALLAIPAAGLAQTPAPQPPPSQQQPPSEQPLTEPPAQQPPTEQPASRTPPSNQPPAQQPPTEAPAPAQPATSQSTSKQSADAVSPEEHLRQAKAALDSIPAAAVTGRARMQIAELKRHMNALDKGSSASTTPAAGATRSRQGAPAGAAAKDSWGTEVAAIDKILGELTATDTPTATTGTGGSNKPTGTAGSAAKSAVALDDATLAKLMEVRTHMVAFATAKSAPQSAPKGHDQAMAGDAPAASPTATQGSPSAAASEASAAQSTAAAAGSPSNAADTASTQAPASASTTTAPQVDQEAVRRHLTAARDSLAELTKLPAAAQLQGDVRTQVSQLIANFNELVTTQSNWTASYAKVEANLNALLGSDAEQPTAAAASPAPEANPVAPAPAATTGASTDAQPTAVGTSGTAKAELDPAVREKLVDLRRNLSEFKKAAGATQ